MERARALAALDARQRPARDRRHASRRVNRGLDSSLDEGCRVESDHFGLLSATDDMREGMTAFLEKRPATFTGR